MGELIQYLFERGPGFFTRALNLQLLHPTRGVNPWGKAAKTKFTLRYEYRYSLLVNK